MYRHWPKRDPIKYYFPLPNELFALGLTSSEISIYAYLLRWAHRETAGAAQQTAVCQCKKEGMSA